MPSDSTVWYRVGYALERAKGSGASKGDRANGRKPSGRSRSADRPDWPTADDLVASGVAALAGKLLSAWRPSRKVGVGRLIRAALAGAGAALLVDLLKPLLSGRAELPDIDRDTGANMLAGASQGLLYGALVEPRVPGHPIFKGAVFALAEYMAHPAGGLSHVLGSHTPLGRLPVVSDLVDDLATEEREYLEHFVFGVAVALLCGPGPALGSLTDDDSDD